ncbi:hypothetical protein EKO24_001685 [Candidatus Methylobacter oryzae]|uniref:Uncharacterized protein n=1 Tax=Candidatus Methylobacter oryzae TaxID=2497749 RepID=A0ABY3CGX7_9GAMM|nr:hypothetical protein EKO24_001685 [Candidatus Methylobacter oryzae]
MLIAPPSRILYPSRTRHAAPSTTFALVPKLQLGNSVQEAPASRLAKLKLRHLGSQAGAWEPA